MNLTLKLLLKAGIKQSIINAIVISIVTDRETAYTDLPGDVYHASLAVLAEELLARDNGMEATMVMVAKRCETAIKW